MIKYHKHRRAAFRTQPDVNYAVTYDGLDELFNCNEGFGSIVPNNAAHTIHFWIKTTDSTTNTFFGNFILGDVVNLSNLYYFYSLVSAGSTDNYIQGFWRSGGRRHKWRGSTIINDGNWHRIVISIPSTAGQFTTPPSVWVDGSLETLTWTNGASINANAISNNFQVGGYSSVSYTNTSLAQIAIYNTNLNSTQVGEIGTVYNDLSSLSSNGNLIRYWKIQASDITNFPSITDNTGNNVNTQATNMESSDISIQNIAI